MKNKRGITLLALIITIIILLILAGVSISLVVGDNGVLKQSQNASTKTNKATEFETVQLSIAGSFNDEGYLDLETLVTNLTNEVAEPKTIETAKEENIDVFPVTVTATYGKYEIDGNGRIEKISGIELSQSSITITEGEEYIPITLTATLTGELMGKTVTWNSTNTNLVTVNNGTVNLAETLSGDSNTAEIEAVVTVGDQKYIGTCIVTYVETQVHSIEVTVNPSTLIIGKTTGTATTTKKGIFGKDLGTITSGVTYTSSDTTKATVSGSTITGVAEGEVTITSTANGLTGTCTINVQNPPPQIGDFVNYSAGNWTTDDLELLGVTFNENKTAITDNGSLYTGGALPTDSAPYKFGGFTAFDADAGTNVIRSKDSSVNAMGTNTYSGGWRILELDETKTYVKRIIHAGTPEGFFNTTTGGNTSKAKLESRNWNMYATGTYGVSATVVSFDDMQNSKYNSVKATGSTYWIPEARQNMWGGYFLWFVNWNR